MKVITIRRVVVATLAVVAVILARTRNQWIQNVRSLEYTLLATDENKAKDSDGAHQSWADLPPVVQRYFNRVFSPAVTYGGNDESPFHPDQVPMHLSIHFQQKGLFAAKQGKWLPFTAHQTVSTVPGNPGFVWEADMDILKGRWNRFLPKIQVCDAWVKGEGHMVVSLHGMLTLVSAEAFADHKDALRKGEMMRWLAEAFLYPTALLPEAGVVFWKNLPNPDKALLSMIDPFYGSLAELEIDFDHGNGIEMRGIRPAVTGNTVVDRSWVGRMSDFQLIENMWIPTYAEVGWVNELSEELDLYLTANLSAFQFERAHKVQFDHEDTTSTQ